MKLVVAILIVFLFFVVKPIEAATMSTSVPSGSAYAPERNYGFEIECSDIPNISNVTFEWNGLNYTSPAVNNNGNTYWINVTDQATGNYLYKWIIENTSNAFEFGDSYTISKNSTAQLTLTLNGTDGNRSYNLNDDANFIATLNIPNKLIYLNSNYPGFVEQNSQTSSITILTLLSSPGVFSLTARYDGDTNYSSTSKTYYYDNVPPQYSTRSEYPTNPPDYSPNNAYTFGMAWSDVTLNQVWFESNFSGTLKNYTNSTTPDIQIINNNFIISILNLPAETFVYRWIASDSLNKQANTTTYEYTIMKKFPLTIEISPSKTVMKGTRTIVICHSITDQIPVSNFKFYRNNTLITNDSTLSRKDDQLILDEGAHEYICNNTATQNYTNQTTRVILTVTLNTTPPTFIKTINLAGPSSIQANIGETTQANFFLENNLGESISNISASLTGILSNWYVLSDLASSIPDNFSLIIKINFTIPSDAQQGDYNFTLRATARTTNETKVLTKSAILSVVTPPSPQIFPPVYSSGYTNKTFSGYEFYLKWNDETGLSGYIFSSNETGGWINDTWVPFSGTEGWSYSFKPINVSTVVAWKFFVNDSNDLWVESEEYYLNPENIGSTDMTLPIIIVSVFVVILAAVLLIFEKIRSKSKKSAPKKENVVYVYSKEDLK